MASRRAGDSPIHAVHSRLEANDRRSDTRPMLTAWIVAYFATGAFVGFLAGLLGIGGGMNIAASTGMASIMFTSTASVRAHHRLGGVDWALVRRMGPAMVVGTLLATALSGWVPQRALALAFSAIVYAGATQLLLGRKPSAARTLPGPMALVAIGLLIGVVCGLVSAGGAFMTVPFMLFCGVAMTTAIGTGAALGLPVAIVGTLGYVFSGWHVPELPPLSLGFVYAPALLAIVAGSVLTAPLGARAAHRLPVATLRRIFAGLLYVLATKMLWTYL